MSSSLFADLAGKWRHTSFLLDPDSLIPATPPGAAKQSMAELWATGALDLEVSAGGDTLTGQLTFPNRIQLAVTVREAPDLFGDAPGVLIEGSGTAPGPAGSVTLLYHLAGALSPDWRKSGSPPVIVGAIRAAGFDPRGPIGTVGAFMLVR